MRYAYPSFLTFWRLHPVFVCAFAAIINHGDAVALKKNLLFGGFLPDQYVGFLEGYMLHLTVVEAVWRWVGIIVFVHVHTVLRFGGHAVDLEAAVSTVDATRFLNVLGHPIVRADMVMGAAHIAESIFRGIITYLLVYRLRRTTGKDAYTLFVRLRRWVLKFLSVRADGNFGTWIRRGRSELSPSLPPRSSAVAAADVLASVVAIGAIAFCFSWGLPQLEAGIGWKNGQIFGFNMTATAAMMTNSTHVQTVLGDMGRLGDFSHRAALAAVIALLHIFLGVVAVTLERTMGILVGAVTVAVVWSSMESALWRWSEGEDQDLLGGAGVSSLTQHTLGYQYTMKLGLTTMVAGSCLIFVSALASTIAQRDRRRNARQFLTTHAKFDPALAHAFAAALADPNANFEEMVATVDVCGCDGGSDCAVDGDCFPHAAHHSGGRPLPVWGHYEHRQYIMSHVFTHFIPLTLGFLAVTFGQAFFYTCYWVSETQIVTQSEREGEREIVNRGGERARERESASVCVCVTQRRRERIHLCTYQYSSNTRTVLPVYYSANQP